MKPDDLTVNGETSLVGDVTYSGSFRTAGGGAHTMATGDAFIDGDMDIQGDLTVEPLADGGNGGLKNEISGLPRITLAGAGTGLDGSVETTSYMDDTPDGEWTAIDADVIVSADATYFKMGSKSLKLSFAGTAADDDGAVVDIVNDDLEANEYIGFWIYSDVALDAGDLDILIDDTDAAPDQSYNVCAVEADVWTWCDVDVSALAAGTGNVVDKVGVVLKKATGLGEFNVYLDTMWKYDEDHDTDLNAAALMDGVLSVVNTETGAVLTDQTDYFISYRSGDDYIVYITNQSAADVIALVAY